FVHSVEPFKKLVNPGVVLGENHEKMSKSAGNVVNPDDVIAEYGADALRMFEMFMGPLTVMKPWSTSGVEGVYRFLSRVWRMLLQEDDAVTPKSGNWRLSESITDSPSQGDFQRLLHKTVKRVT